MVITPKSTLSVAVPPARVLDVRLEFDPDAGLEADGNDGKTVELEPHVVSTNVAFVSVTCVVVAPPARASLSTRLTSSRNAASSKLSSPKSNSELCVLGLGITVPLIARTFPEMASVLLGAFCSSSSSSLSGMTIGGCRCGEKSRSCVMASKGSCVRDCDPDPEAK